MSAIMYSAKCYICMDEDGLLQLVILNVYMCYITEAFMCASNGWFHMRICSLLFSPFLLNLVKHYSA